MKTHYTIPSVPTLYKGTRFRSRLEARWAMFFDVAGIRHEYEPDGVRLSDGSFYLPDFWLPDLLFCVEDEGTRTGAFVEIKPENWPDGCGVRGADIMLRGSPSGLWEYVGTWGDAMHACDIAESGGFATCCMCGRHGFTFESRCDYIPCGCVKPGEKHHCVGDWPARRIVEAYATAKSAYFDRRTNSLVAA